MDKKLILPMICPSDHPDFPLMHWDEDEIKSIRDYAIKCIKANLSCPNYQVAAVPDGWKLVPIKPTDEMERIGWRNQHPIAIYENMISVAPSHPSTTKEMA